MNEINNAKNTAKNITNPETKFSGYTLEEIRYQRALVALQAEFCKTKMARNFRNLQNSNPLSASSVASSIPAKQDTLRRNFSQDSTISTTRCSGSRCSGL